MRYSIALAVLLTTICPPRLSADEVEDDAARAQSGDFEAMLRVGLAYLSDADKGNDIDGIKWLEMSSGGGVVDAYYNLGVIYQDGRNAKPDAGKAVMYLTVAAELGEVRAMNRLAGIYYKGGIVPTNDVLAVKWGLCAAGLGSKTAQENMEQMRSQVDKKSAALGAQMAKAWAKNRLRKAAEPAAAKPSE